MVHVIDQAMCTRCGSCKAACPPRTSAENKTSGRLLAVPDQPIPVVRKARPARATSDEGGDQ
jgi:Fe-S-cluster-containing dehydrogenase component